MSLKAGTRRLTLVQYSHEKDSMFNNGTLNLFVRFKILQRLTKKLLESLLPRENVSTVIFVVIVAA